MFQNTSLINLFFRYIYIESLLEQRTSPWYIIRQDVRIILLFPHPLLYDSLSERLRSLAQIDSSCYSVMAKWCSTLEDSLSSYGRCRRHRYGIPTCIAPPVRCGPLYAYPYRDARQVFLVARARVRAYTPIVNIINSYIKAILLSKWEEKTNNLLFLTNLFKCFSIFYEMRMSGR